MPVRNFLNQYPDHGVGGHLPYCLGSLGNQGLLVAFGHAVGHDRELENYVRGRGALATDKGSEIVNK